MPATDSAAANSKPVADALAKKKPVLDAALQNAFMAALPGENDDVELDDGDAAKLNKKIAELAAQLAQPDNVVPIRKNIDGFGAPEPTDAPPNSNPAAAHDPGSAANILSDDAGEEVPPEARSAMGGPEQAGSAAPRTPRSAPPAAANPGAAPQDPNQTDAPPAEDQGLQHCATCGRIKKPDGTCPNGCEQPYNDSDKKREAQAAAAGQAPAADAGAAPPPTGADGTPRPQRDDQSAPGQGPNSQAQNSPQQQKNTQELEWIQGNLKRDRASLKTAQENFKKYEKKHKYWRLIAVGATVSVVFALFIPIAQFAGTIAWYYSYKKRKAAKKIKEIEADIKTNESKEAALKKKT